jgi:hypothetical protein
MGSWAGIWMSATSLLTGYLLQAGFTQQSPAPLLDLPALFFIAENDHARVSCDYYLGNEMQLYRL